VRQVWANRPANHPSGTGRTAPCYRFSNLPRSGVQAVDPKAPPTSLVFGDTLPRLPSADEVRHGAPPRRCLPRLHRGGWAMLADGL